MMFAKTSIIVANTCTSCMSRCSTIRTSIRTSASTNTSTSTTTSTSGSARSVYVSQIRRAFLLRVHPDRFRHMNTTSPSTTTPAHTSIQQQQYQQQQASLVKALATRMNEYDFKQWQLGYNNNSNTNNYNMSMSSNNNNIYPFIMERRDGSYINYQLNLSNTVESILQDMVKALQLSGATTPSIPISTNTNNNTNTTTTNSMNNNSNTMFFYNGVSSSSNNIDRRYDKVSQQGRSISSFLLNNNTMSSSSTSFERGEQFGSSTQQNQQSLTLIEQIQQRKLYRIDAQALAREIRTVYQFQSIEATQTGWSSQSICIVLRRFLDMYDDYSTSLNVSSFYPLRLIFAPSIDYIINTKTNNNNTHGNDNDDITNDDVNNNNNNTIQLTDHVFDMYEGIVRLHPAWTTNQWLTIIRLIQPYHIQNVHKNILQRQYYTNKINLNFGIKIKKGFSCSSSEYNIFLHNIYQSIVQKQKEKKQQQAQQQPQQKEEEEEDDQKQQQGIVDTIDTSNTSSLVDHASTSLVTIENSKYVIATIESSYSIRRRSLSSLSSYTVLSTGQIQFHNKMNLYDCTTTIQKLLPTAIQYSLHHNTIMKQQIQQIIIQLQIHLGIQRIYKASNFVTYEQYYNTLHRLLQTLFIEPNNDTNTTSNDNNSNNNNDETNEQRRKHDQKQQDFELIKRQLSGNSLGISVEGQFCHLADDGSILIPHNWTV